MRKDIKPPVWDNERGQGRMRTALEPIGKHDAVVDERTAFIERGAIAQEAVISSLAVCYLHTIADGQALELAREEISHIQIGP